MNLSWRSISFAVAFALLGIAASTARATKVITVSNGQSIDGWEVVFPSTVSFTADSSPNLTLQETGAFDSLSPLNILFVQQSYNASPTITIDSLTLTNSSGMDLQADRKHLIPIVSGNTAAPSIMTTFTLSNPSSEVFNRSTVTSDSVLFRGQFDNGLTARLQNGALVVNANPVTSGIRKIFFLNDEAVPFVPVPPAVWSGLSVMLGLGLIGGVRKIKRSMA